MRTDEQMLTEFFNEIEDLLQNDDVLKMADFISHGKTDCLSHCLAVAYEAFVKCRKRKLDARAAARGGLLHDFYLYDHTDKIEMQKRGGRHVRAHARAALINADEHFTLTNKERDIILKHMWPVNITRPLFRESLIVNFVDTRRAVLEFIRLDKLSGVMLASALDYVKHAEARKARANAKAEAEAASAEAAKARKLQDEEDKQTTNENFTDVLDVQQAAENTELGAAETDSTKTVETIAPLCVDGAKSDETATHLFADSAAELGAKSDEAATPLVAVGTAEVGAAKVPANVETSPVQTNAAIEENAATDDDSERFEVGGAETTDNLDKFWRDCESSNAPETNSANANAEKPAPLDVTQSGIITAEESAISQPKGGKVLGDIYISPLPPREAEEKTETPVSYKKTDGERSAFERRPRADRNKADTSHSERRRFERTQVSHERKPFERTEIKPEERKLFERPERKPFERAEIKPEEHKPFERPEHKPFERTTTKSEIERKPFERPERKPFERTTTKSETESKPFERPERKTFEHTEVKPEERKK